MNRRLKLEIFAVASIGIACLAVVLSSMFSRPERVMFITGAVLQEDHDPQRQLPLPDVEITMNEPAVAQTKSEASGFFRLSLGEGVVVDRTIQLSFRHPEYLPRYLTFPAGGELRIVRMSPKARDTDGQPNGPRAKVSEIRMRYAVKNRTIANVGSAAKSFEVANAAESLVQLNLPARRIASGRLLSGLYRSMPASAGSSET